MDWADAGNAAFESAGAILMWRNVLQLRRDKQVRGVYWPAWAFFAVWGMWNVFYYGPALGQWLSWWAGLALVSGNLTWVFLAFKYRRN